MKRPGLGRLVKRDDRDMLHLMSAHLPARVPTKTKIWAPGAVLDQGQSSMCVAYSWGQFMQATPMRTKLDRLFITEPANTRGRMALPVPQALERIYIDAQQIDGIAGHHDGTTVRAAASVLQKQLGRLAEYVWATGADDVRRFVLSRGPVIVGTNWFTKMYETDAKGYLHPEGKLEGGHAWTIIGFSESRNAFRMVNSWGTQWGEKGRAWISYADLEGLITDGGEACSAIECKPEQS